MTPFPCSTTLRAAALATSLVAAPLLHGWQPGTASPAAAEGFTVDATNRRDVLAFYNCVYAASENYAANIGWTGNVATGQAGTTTATFKDDVKRRINFFRALVGQQGDIVFNTTKSDKNQAAALMMAANNSLSHTPPASWTWYTAAGAEAAGKSNIALGNYGPAAVNAYIRDDGGGNEIVGHRRWLLYRLAREMGTGDIPSGGGYNSANTIWVLTDFKTSAADKFVAWPNKGYAPVSLIPARWSLSYPNAGFGSATVTMTQNGTNVPLTVISRTANGYGDNTIVWTPTGVPTTVAADLPYVVTVSGITGSGVPTSETYTVTLFDPNVLGETVAVSGTATPPTTGQLYTFNSIAQADSYQLEVTTNSAAAWTEGAEDSPTPQVTEGISTGYTLRQTGLVRTGSKAFQLAYPSGVFDDQSFIITRSIIPTSTSQLQYYDRSRWCATTTTLETQVSADGGATWTTVATRNGVSSTGNSTEWDANWISRNISLAGYAGQVINLRFILKRNGGGVYSGVTSNYGMFVDDVTVTNSIHLTNPTLTTLAGTDSSFTLNATTAGGALVGGNGYVMRIRPNVGTRWFGYGPMKTVTAQNPPGYAGWVASQYPAVTGGAAADHDHDGLANGIEYAFGLNPTVANNHAVLPQATELGEAFGFNYTAPADVAGVTYGAEWSDDLATWKPLTDAGSGTNHQFSVSTTGKERVFLRHKIVIAP